MQDTIYTPVKSVSIREDIRRYPAVVRHAYSPYRLTWECVKGWSKRIMERIRCAVRREPQPQWVFAVTDTAAMFYYHKPTKSWDW